MWEIKKGASAPLFMSPLHPLVQGYAVLQRPWFVNIEDGHDHILRELIKPNLEMGTARWLVVLDGEPLFLDKFKQLPQLFGELHGYPSALCTALITLSNLLFMIGLSLILVGMV